MLLLLFQRDPSKQHQTLPTVMHTQGIKLRLLALPWTLSCPTAWAAFDWQTRTAVTLALGQQREGLKSGMSAICSGKFAPRSLPTSLLLAS
jgi:hypothetical protein